MDPLSICFLVISGTLFGLFIGAQDRKGNFSFVLAVMLSVLLFVITGALVQSQLT